MMGELGWCTEKTHGSKYQSGWPDLLALHSVHGVKWIEMKQPGRPLRASQIALFKKWSKYGAKIYVLHSERDYDLLFDKPNWQIYAALPGNISLPSGFGRRETERDI